MKFGLQIDSASPPRGMCEALVRLLSLVNRSGSFRRLPAWHACEGWSQIVLVSALLLVFASRSYGATATLYVTDLGDSKVMQYTVTYTGTSYTVSAPTTGTTFATISGTAGSYSIAGITGFANDVIVANATTLSRYKLDGTTVGSAFGVMSVKNLAGSAAQTWTSIADIQGSADGKYLYVVDSSSGIYKIDLAANKVAASYSVTGAKGMYLDNTNGLILFTRGGQTTGDQLTYLKTSDMSTHGTLLTYNTTLGSGATANLSDVTVVNGKLYGTASTALNANVTVQYWTYTVTSGTPALSAYNSTTYQAGAAGNTNGYRDQLGLVAGPDGSTLFGSAQELQYAGGSTYNNSTAGGIDPAGIYQITLGTGGSLPSSLTTVLTGLSSTASGSNPTIGTNGLYTPQFAVFNTSFSSTPDAGTPEPGQLGLILALGATVGVAIRRKRGTRPKNSACISCRTGCLTTGVCCDQSVRHCKTRDVSHKIRRPVHSGSASGYSSHER